MDVKASRRLGMQPQCILKMCSVAWDRAIATRATVDQAVHILPTQLGFGHGHLDSVDPHGYQRLGKPTLVPSLYSGMAPRPAHGHPDAPIDLFGGYTFFGKVASGTDDFEMLLYNHCCILSMVSVLYQ